MKVKFTIPTSKSQIALSDYQEFSKIVELNKGHEDGAFVLEKMVSIFCGVDMKDLRLIQYDHFEVIVDQLSKAFEAKSKHKQIIEVAGQKFGMIPNFDEMTFGEFVDLDEYAKHVSTYDKFMSVLYRPITARVKDMYEIETYKGSEHLSGVMKNASLEDTEGALLFFWNLGRELLKATQRYLKEELTKTSTASEQFSEQSTDGINPSLRLQTETLLKSAELLSATYMNAFTSYNLIKSVWILNRGKLKERD